MYMNYIIIYFMPVVDQLVRHQAKVWVTGIMLNYSFKLSSIRYECQTPLSFDTWVIELLLLWSDLLLSRTHYPCTNFQTAKPRWWRCSDDFDDTVGVRHRWLTSLAAVTLTYLSCDRARLLLTAFIEITIAEDTFGDICCRNFVIYQYWQRYTKRLLIACFKWEKYWYYYYY